MGVFVLASRIKLYIKCISFQQSDQDEYLFIQKIKSRILDKQQTAFPINYKSNNCNKKRDKSMEINVECMDLCFPCKHHV